MWPGSGSPLMQKFCLLSFILRLNSHKLTQWTNSNKAEKFVFCFHDFWTWKLTNQQLVFCIEAYHKHVGENIRCEIKLSPMNSAWGVAAMPLYFIKNNPFVLKLRCARYDKRRTDPVCERNSSSAEFEPCQGNKLAFLSHVLGQLSRDATPEGCFAQGRVQVACSGGFLVLLPDEDFPVNQLELRNQTWP